MNIDGHPGQPSCNHGRNGYEASLRKEGLRPNLEHDAQRLENSPNDLKTIQQILPRKVATKLTRSYRMEGHVQSRLLDFLILNAMLITNIVDLPAFFDKFWNQEKVEGYMPDRSSACKYNLFHLNLLILQMQREIHRHGLQNYYTYPSWHWQD